MVAAAATLAAALTACGGGGNASLPATGSNTGSAPSQPAPSTTNANAKMVINIPPKTAASSMRNPKYISASTKSMTIGLLSSGKTTPLTEADLTPTSPNCSVVSGGVTQCNVSFIAAATTDTFVVTMYDQIGGKGNVLSTGDVNATLKAGANNTVAVDLDGVPANLSVIVDPATLPVGTASSAAVFVQATDADGNLIIGPGGFASPVSLAISGDKYGTLALSRASVTSPGQVVSLAYNGGSNIGSTVTAATTGVTPATATFAGSGATMSIFQYYDTTNSIYGTPDDALALPNGTGAILMELNGTTPGEGIGIASPTSGIQKVYAGDTSDPYSVPAPGTTYPGLTVVNGMSQSIDYNTLYAYDDMAVDPTAGTIYYSGAYDVTAPASGGQCASGDEEESGTIGAFNPNSGTLVFPETTLKGYAGALKLDSSGNLWWIEYTGECYNGSTWTNLYPSDDYAIGERKANGTIVETPFSSAGLAAVGYPGDMSISADGSKMYIVDQQKEAVYEIATSTLSAPTMLTTTNSGDAYTIATSSDDGTTAWFGDKEVNENYYYGWVPGSKAFAQANLSEARFPLNTFWANTMAYGDGSFWAAGTTQGTGIGRITGLANGTPSVNYYAAPTTGAVTCCPSFVQQEINSVSVGGGYVWATDYFYYNIDVMQYGTPSDSQVTFNSVHRLKPSVTFPKVTHRSTHHGPRPSGE
jgi:hypothetical protein